MSAIIKFVILVQWEQNGGQCGVCGDAYNLRSPRPHEAGGEYGKGIISRRYAAGQVINFKQLVLLCSEIFLTMALNCSAGNRSGN